MASCLGCFFWGWYHRVWPCSSEYIGNKNWTWHNFLFFLGGRHKDRRVGLGRIGIKCDRTALYKIISKNIMFEKKSFHQRRGNGKIARARGGREAKGSRHLQTQLGWCTYELKGVCDSMYKTSRRSGHKVTLLSKTLCRIDAAERKKIPFLQWRRKTKHTPGLGDTVNKQSIHMEEKLVNKTSSMFLCAFGCWLIGWLVGWLVWFGLVWFHLAYFGFALIWGFLKRGDKEHEVGGKGCVWFLRGLGGGKEYDQNTKIKTI